MPVGFLRRMKREKTSTTVVELSITLAVALLLVMTGLRLMGGFGVDLHRASAQPSTSSAEASAAPATVTRAPKVGN